MDPRVFAEPTRVAWMLVLSIIIGCMVFHPWHPAIGQKIDPNGGRSGANDDRSTADVAWSQRIILASGDSFVGTLSGWKNDGTWTFGVIDPTLEKTNESSKDLRQRVVAASDLVRYGVVPLPELASGVLFVDGSELTGRIVELDADTCRLVSRWFDVSIPLESVRSLLFHAPIDEQIRQHQLQAAQQASGANDVVLLIDGGRREGTLRLPKTSVSPRRQEAVVELKTGGDESASIPFRRIGSIIPSPILREDVARRSGAGKGSGGAENASPPRMRVGLVDGSVLSVERGTLTDTSGSSPIVLECGVALTRRRTSQQTALTEIIAMLAPAPLPATCLVAESPLRYRHLPFFGESHPLVRWSAEQSGPVLGGFRYPNGLMMRTAARAVYPAKGATRLTGAVAAADPGWDTATDVQMQANLGTRFRVQTSGPDGQVDQLWDAGVVRPGEAPVSFDLDISGASLIILATDAVDSGDFGDRAVWLDLVTSGGDGR